MLPLFGDKKALVIAAVKPKASDEGKEKMDLLDNAAEDILSAIKDGDKDLLKSALHSFMMSCEPAEEAKEE